MSHRETLIHQRAAHSAALHDEAARLSAAAAALGAQRVILFGSLARGDTALTSDLDLLIVWDTPLGYLDRTVDLYRRLSPRGPVDLLVYTPTEMLDMAERPFVRRILEEGKVLYEA
jgi:predicted nucleotidyltransferase